MSARHCIECGTPLRRISLAGAHREQCPACGHVAWRNPTPVAMALIQHQGQLVMIRRSAAPLANYWAPPAGYVECGESVPEAVIREAREECGLDIELDGLVGVYSRADVDVLIVAYRARSCGGRLVPGDDANEVRLYAPDGLPRQQLPAGGTTTDRWLFTVIRDVSASWRPV